MNADEPGALRVLVDTVAGRTSFDPGFHLLEVESWGSSLANTTFREEPGLRYFDDEFACSHPPPFASCPQAFVPVEAEDLPTLA